MPTSSKKIARTATPKRTMASARKRSGISNSKAKQTRGAGMTRPYDPAEFLRTKRDRIAYLQAALDDGDPALIAHVLGDIARAQGMAEIARKTGLGRESLYKALSGDKNPRLATILKVLQALDIPLKVAA